MLLLISRLTFLTYVSKLPMLRIAMAPVALMPEPARSRVPSSVMFPRSDSLAAFPQKLHVNCLIEKIPTGQWIGDLLLKTVLSSQRAFGHRAGVRSWSSRRSAKMIVPSSS